MVICKVSCERPSRRGCIAHAMPQRPLYGIFRAVWKGASEGKQSRGYSRRVSAMYVLPQRPLFGIFRAVWMRERREWGAKTMGSGSESIMRRPKAVRTDNHGNPNGVLILYLYDSQCVKNAHMLGLPNRGKIGSFG